MGRGVDDEELDRRRAAGRWLRRERDARRLDQQQMADKLGVSQQSYSKYELGGLPIPARLGPEIAKALDLDEPTVWRGLQLPLPGPFRSEEDLTAYYEAKYPRVFQGVEDSLSADGDPGANRRRPGVRPPAVPHKGDKEEEPSQRRASSH